MPDRLIALADSFAHEVYRITKQFPQEERYGLSSQLRRAALSIPLNIIEGFARQRKASYRQFLEIAYGSLREAEYLLRFSYQEKFLEGEESRKLLS